MPVVSRLCRELLEVSFLHFTFCDRNSGIYPLGQSIAGLYFYRNLFFPSIFFHPQFLQPTIFVYVLSIFVGSDRRGICELFLSGHWLDASKNSIQAVLIFLCSKMAHPRNPWHEIIFFMLSEIIWNIVTGFLWWLKYCYPSFSKTFFFERKCLLFWTNCRNRQLLKICVY